MAKSNKQLFFNLIRIRTGQFAVIEEMYKESLDSKISLSYRVGMGGDDEAKVLSFSIKCEFKQEKSPFLIIEVECDFIMSDEAWKDLNPNAKSITIPKSLAIHLVGITISVARGVLHTKTENTYFNKFIIKAIPVSDIVPGDVEMDFIKKENTKPKKTKAAPKSSDKGK